MRPIFFIALALTTVCAFHTTWAKHKPKKTAVMRSALAIPECNKPIDGKNIKDADLCGAQTKEGLACMRCQAAVGCQSEKLQVYCVNSCDDEKCVVRGNARRNKRFAFE